MELSFIFSPIRPFFDKTLIYNLKETHHFDSRQGLDLLFFGFDSFEIEEPNRLLYQLENALDFDLNYFNFWSDKVYKQKIRIKDYLDFLIHLKKRLGAQRG